MLVTFLVLSMALQPFESNIQWQVPFTIDRTGLSPQGVCAFVSGEKVYLYTPNGQLQSEFTLEKPLQFIWLTQDDVLWALSDGVLSAYDFNGVLIDSAEIGSLVLEPVSIKQEPALATKDDISVFELLDYQNKKAIHRFSLELNDLYSMNPTRGQMLLSCQNGRKRIWYPFEGVSYPYNSNRNAKIKFYTISPANSSAIVYEDRVLQVRKGSKNWTKSFTLDINNRPLWLSYNGNEALAFLSEDRVLRIFSAIGLEAQRFSLPYRPRDLIQLDPESVLVTMHQADFFVIYDFKLRKLIKEQIQSPLIDIKKNGPYLLYHNLEGHIKLMKIRPTEPS